MKIVVLDGYTENPGDLSWEKLEALGEVTVYDRCAPGDTDAVIRRIGDAPIVVTNKTPITREILDACPGIRFISVLATGYNVVDAAAAREKGIPVSNVPSYGTEAVAQYSIALLLEVCHHIGHHDRTVKEGRWQRSDDWCYWDHPLIELAGKTIGIIGFGRIGKTEGRIAKAMGMRVLACDPRPDDAGREIAAYVSLDELYAQSDVISLHCNLTADNAGMINAESIAKMKDGAILINNARGQLIREKDLADALNGGKLAAAALDVVSEEPIRADNPLLFAKNCILTPHISWASKECRARIMDCTAENIRAFLSDRPIHVVNG
ncbi:MAG: D-2-hydroxyacid dehydrogenase [Lachnospiraceae bacterium]|nr:D-2-hydroxyacid dehydrogenase [Lachnospiraceae bacterium]